MEDISAAEKLKNEANDYFKSNLNSVKIDWFFLYILK